MVLRGKWAEARVETSGSAFQRSVHTTQIGCVCVGPLCQGNSCRVWGDSSTCAHAQELLGRHRIRGQSNPVGTCPMWLSGFFQDLA